MLDIFHHLKKNPIEATPTTHHVEDKDFQLTEIPVHPQLVLDNAYFKNNLPGTSSKMYIRKCILNKIFRILSILPTHYGLCIFDGFRTLQTQKAVFEIFRHQIQELYQLGEKESFHRTLSLVPLPQYTPQPLPHNTGGAVDLTLLYKGYPVPMGTAFDDPNEKSSTLYFEKPYDSNCSFSKQEWELYRTNRRVLVHLMMKEGFTFHPQEWWHFDFGNSAWALRTNNQPLFGSAEDESTTTS